MKLNGLILLMLSTISEITATANRPENLRIDAMLPATVEISEEALLFDHQTIYRFNVETSELSDPLNASKFFKDIEFPVNAASFNRRKQNGAYVNLVVFSKQNNLFLCYFSEQLKAKDRILDKVENFLQTCFPYPMDKQWLRDMTGLTSDFSKGVTEDINLILCDGNMLATVEILKGNYLELPSPVNVKISPEKVEGCKALTVVEKHQVYYLLMATDDSLKMFQLEGGQVDKEIDYLLDIKRNVLGQRSWTSIIIIALVVGILLVAIAFLAFFGMVVYQRKRNETVKMDMRDKPSMDSNIPQESVLRRNKK